MISENIRKNKIETEKEVNTRKSMLDFARQWIGIRMQYINTVKWAHLV